MADEPVRWSAKRRNKKKEKERQSESTSALMMQE
jgi:hypothetical protein